MNSEVRKAEDRPLTMADRQQAVAESLRQIARVSRFADRKKGIRSLRDQGKGDPLRPILFLICFVLPTLLGALYYGVVASDRYVTQASFVIRPAIGGDERNSGDSGVKEDSTTSTEGQMVSQDRQIIKAYILSRPMIEAVERQLPIREWFGRDTIDWFSRFDPEKPIEKLVRYWGNRVDTPTSDSSIINLAVEAFDPAESLAIAKAVLTEAERMVNDLSRSMRADALAESTRELRLAEEKLARLRLEERNVRNQFGVLDAGKSNEADIKALAELRATRINLATQLAIGQRDLSPEARRIIDIKQQIKGIDDNIARIERASTSQDPDQKRSLSDALMKFEAIAYERKDMEKQYQAVLMAYERARIVSARQIEFFSPIVQPVKAESSTQPRRLLMTGLIAAGAALLFVVTLHARKLMA